MTDTIPKPDSQPEPKRDDAKLSDKQRPENEQGPLSERLDEALEDTFPSSDPVAVKITK